MIKLRRQFIEDFNDIVRFAGYELRNLVRIIQVSRIGMREKPRQFAKRPAPPIHDLLGENVVASLLHPHSNPLDIQFGVFQDHIYKADIRRTRNPCRFASRTKLRYFGVERTVSTPTD